jgi:hypothetical protein
VAGNGSIANDANSGDGSDGVGPKPEGKPGWRKTQLVPDNPKVGVERANWYEHTA